jgi:uncharacterized membrane protein
MNAKGTKRKGSITAIVRTAISLSFGIIGGIIIGYITSFKYAPLIGWGITALTYLIWIWHTLHGKNAEDTATLATSEDPSHAVTDIVLVCASVASLIAIGILLVQVSKETNPIALLLSLLSIVSVMLSWATVHTIYTLLYARMFYADVGSIDFNNSKMPCYSDFLYMSFTIGMTFQVSDTQVKSSVIRRAILQQALLSYVFGTIIIAITINFIASLGK